MSDIIRGEGFLKITDADKEEMKGGRLTVPVPLFERRDAPFETNGQGDGALILGLEGDQATKKRIKGKAKVSGEAKASNKIVRFSAGASLLSPPATPASQQQPSLFGNGLPASKSTPNRRFGFAV
jgi:hypothetical protein